MTYISRGLERELKKGSAELLILSLVEERARHGYEISKLIAARSEGRLKFKVASLYPLLYRLEERGWIAGRWIEKAGERRRRFYRLTPEGRRVLAAQRDLWQQFVEAIARITRTEHAGLALARRRAAAAAPARSRPGTRDRGGARAASGRHLRGAARGRYPARRRGTAGARRDGQGRPTPPR